MSRYTLTNEQIDSIVNCTLAQLYPKVWDGRVVTKRDAEAYFLPEGYWLTRAWLMSNSDGKIDRARVNLLKMSRVILSYAATHFFGSVWFANKRFHCCVQVLGVPVEVISAKTPRGLMRAVSDKYGWE